MFMNSSIPTPVTASDVEVVRKKRVVQTSNEVSKITDQVFLMMQADGVKFPIGLGFRGLSGYYEAAQAKILPADRHATFGTPDRKGFISNLNYRNKKADKAVEVKVQDTTSVPITPELTNAVVEVATLVRDYLSKDKEAMKLFTATLLGFGK